MPKSHTVQPGHTLTAIAKHYGKTVQELVEINHLKNPNRLEVGQVIYLDRAYAHSVQVVLLDWLRYPIPGLTCELRFDGKRLVCQSGNGGLLPLISTDNIQSKVEVWVKNVQDEWRKIGQTVSGLGQQWLTLISPAVKFNFPLAPHDETKAAKPFKPEHDSQKPAPSQAKGQPIREGHGAHTRKSSKNTNTIVLEVPIPPELLSYFDGYTPGEVTADQWKNAAEDLECEPEVLRAIAKVESGGREAFWQVNPLGKHVPVLVFERHKFSRQTKHRYDKTDPDISWPRGYLTKAFLQKQGLSIGSAYDKLHDGRVDEDDTYGSNARGYLRLLKAYRLDPEAALRSCSWGKFQILGENHELCDVPRIRKFVETMCAGEAGQLNLLRGFIRRKPLAKGASKTLWQAVKDKDWHMIAYNYNGADYKTVGPYDEKLKAAYSEYKKGAA